MTIYLLVKFTMTISQMCDLFQNKMFLQYKSSNNIVFDKKNLFTSNFWSILCYCAKIKRRLNIAFYSQIDEQIERQNQILKQYLRCYCNYKQNNWVALFCLIQFVYNNAKYTFTKLLLFKVVLNYELKFNWKWNDKSSNVSTIKKQVNILLTQRENLEKRVTRVDKSQIKFANKRIKFMSFNINQKIMFFIKNLKQIKFKKKFANKYTKSFEILDIVDSQTYKLQFFSK